MSPFDPDWVVAPGETLAEWFQDSGLRPADAAAHGIPPRTLARLFAGQEPLDGELAAKIADMTGISAAFWLAAERSFRDGLAAGKTWTRP